MGCVAVVFFAAASAFSTMPADGFVPTSLPTNAVPVALDVRPGNNMCLVKAEIDGKSCTLLFDTGASHTTLDESFVRREMPDVELVPVAIGGSTNVRKVPNCFRAKKLKVGEAEFGVFNVMTLDLAHLEKGVGAPVQGILGMNVIGSVPTEISLGNRRVTFRAEKPEGYGPACTSLQPNCAYLSVTHQDKEFKLLVDSGSSFTFLEKGLWRSTSGSQKMAVTDVNGRANGAPEYGVPGTLELGIPLNVRPMIGGGQGNLLGADTLMDYDLFVDFPQLCFRRCVKDQE